MLSNVYDIIADDWANVWQAAKDYGYARVTIKVIVCGPDGPKFRAGNPSED